MKWIVVGLGNPGGEYADTRHNAGKIVLASLFDRFATGDWKEHKTWGVIAAKGEIVGKEVLLVAPLTFMNESGRSLLHLVKSPKQAEQTIVIHDDIDLPLGTWRIAFERGSGGHNGVNSIMKTIKTKAFVRVRIGIAPVGADGRLRKPKAGSAVNKFVLGKFMEGERKSMAKVTKEVCGGVADIIAKGRERAMSEWN